MQLISFSSNWVRHTFVHFILKPMSIFSKHTQEHSLSFSLWFLCLPGWLSGERVWLTTWWLWVWYPVEANSLSGIFLPLISAEACEKSCQWLWKESCVSTGMRKPGNTYMCFTDCHDMSLAVSGVKPQYNQPTMIFVNWKVRQLLIGDTV